MITETKDGDCWVYECSKCRRAYRYGRRKAVSEICCGHQPKHNPQKKAVDCPHRGPVVATITGRVAGCGCSGSTVEVYECKYFHEPVTKYGSSPCLDTLQEQVPGATGRTCHGCEVPASSSAETEKP